ncbi:hypothetical protein CUMW_045390 [Citrus unshiu]|nr:hypothetical protein CUMW_045390 [Citrus unshiu]
MDYLGINIGCVTGSLRDGKFPEKDCLLPLLSKVLGYLIVALSTTVKLPQALPLKDPVEHSPISQGRALILLPHLSPAKPSVLTSTPWYSSCTQDITSSSHHNSSLDISLYSDMEIVLLSQAWGYLLSILCNVFSGKRVLLSSRSRLMAAIYYELDVSFYPTYSHSSDNQNILMTNEMDSVLLRE